MEIKLIRLGLRLYFTLNIRRIREVAGVNNRIDAETYFPMWDFDDIPLDVVIESLRDVQEMFNLPDIHIIGTGKENGYHAYCFKSCSFVEARGIIAFTPNVDRHFLAAGAGRGYYTLRFSEVKGREFERVGCLGGRVAPDLSYSDVNSFVTYTKAVK